MGEVEEGGGGVRWWFVQDSSHPSTEPNRTLSTGLSTESRTTAIFFQLETRRNSSCLFLEEIAIVLGKKNANTGVVLTGI
jgi:hypothetical protein